jgi:hypothetical protein
VRSAPLFQLFRRACHNQACDSDRDISQESSPRPWSAKRQRAGRPSGAMRPTRRIGIFGTAVPAVACLPS